MAVPAVPTPAAGTLFANRFEMDRPVGAGGMGLVYRARDRYTGDWVALKVLHDSMAATSLQARFLKEAQILSELVHPHVVSYVAHGESPDGRRFLAMEWLEGQDLAQRLRQGPLDLQSALSLLEYVADGLAAAHQRGIIHRDIKPANLFLPNGDLEKVKILDFGVARRADMDASFTQTGTVIGTPEYMSPEQARGLRDLSAATDIFALGCVFHQCLTGKSPFAADSAASVLVRILFDEAPLLAQPPADFPSGLIGLLQKMLSKEPEQRFPDAVALLMALRCLRQAESPGPTAELRRPITLSGYTLAGREGDPELFSVVFVQPPDRDSEVTRTLSTTRSASQEEVVSSLQAMGLRLETLLGGAMVITVPAMESAVDQAAQAARAALLIRRLWPEARIALATGRGVVKGQMAIGEVASRALQTLTQSSEQEALAEPTGEASPGSGVWLDRLSAQLLPPSFAVSGTGEHRLLFKEHEAVDESRPLLGKPTPCVGREAELATLEAHLSTCLDDGEFRGILVTWPPGSGKSRLRHEFLRRVTQRREECRILVGRGELLSAGAPYHILSNALRSFFGLLAELSPQDLRERLEAIAEACNDGEPTDSAARIRPEFLGELCGRSLPEEHYPALQTARQDPNLMQFQLRRTFLAWLEQECKKGPLLFLLDDLHWGDALSLSLLDHAMQGLPASPWFILALARSEVHTAFPKLWQERPVLEVPLKGLGRKACERLIQHAMGNKVPSATVAKLIEQAAGNVLFLEEPMPTLKKPQQLRVVPTVCVHVGLASGTPFRGALTSRKWCTGGAR